MNPNSLVKDLAPPLFRYFRSTMREEDADDLTSETVCRVLEGIKHSKYDSQKGTLKAFAFGYAHNIKLEFFKKSKRHTLVAVPDAEISAESHFDPIDNRLTIRSGLKKLTLAEQNIISLMIEKDLTMNEISEIIDTPLNTIKSHIHRAKEKLRDHMEERR